MTIEETKKRKRKLELAIGDLITNFNNDTGAYIQRVVLESISHKNQGEPETYMLANVKCEVSL